MSYSYVVLTDSCSDLSMDLISKYNLNVYPMEFILDGKAYRNYPDHREIDIKTFYQKIKDGSTGTTSQMSPDDFIKFFTPYLDDGKDILYVGFSSGLSGTYQNSLIAKEMLIEKYPDRKIICIDTLSASTAEGKIVIDACQNQVNGMSLEENEKDIKAKVPNLTVWFTVDDLNTLKRGGRVTPTAAFIGNLLRIKPVLHVDDNGKLIAMKKANGRKKSLQEMINVFASNAIDPENDIIYIASACADEDEEFVAKKIKEEFKVKNICFSKIGPVIGTHSGPGTLLLTYYGKKR